MSRATFDFSSDLKRGFEGEQSILQRYGNKLEKLDGIKADFKIKSSNKLVELKTDFYRPENFFMETYSNKNSKFGGPYRSLLDKVDYYLYYFFHHDRIFWFDTRYLAKFVRQNENRYRKSYPQNINWCGEGLIIPVKDLEYLSLKENEILC